VTPTLPRVVAVRGRLPGGGFVSGARSPRAERGTAVDRGLTVSFPGFKRQWAAVTQL